MQTNETDLLIAAAREKRKDIEIMLKSCTHQIIDVLDTLEEHLVKLLKILSQNPPH